MSIILLGPPGVGKGTAANKLSQKLGMPHIATGDMLRENVAKKTKLGMKPIENHLCENNKFYDTVINDKFLEFILWLHVFSTYKNCTNADCMKKRVNEYLKKNKDKIFNEWKSNAEKSFPYNGYFSSCKTESIILSCENAYKHIEMESDSDLNKILSADGSKMLSDIGNEMGIRNCGKIIVTFSIKGENATHIVKVFTGEINGKFAPFMITETER